VVVVVVSSLGFFFAGPCEGFSSSADSPVADIAPACGSSFGLLLPRLTRTKRPPLVHPGSPSEPSVSMAEEGSGGDSVRVSLVDAMAFNCGQTGPVEDDEGTCRVSRGVRCGKRPEKRTAGNGRFQG
jgi:hypothetical protein